jgi:hypothetical protein
MFFRRERPRTPSPNERMDALRHAGFQVSSNAGAIRVARNACAIDLKEEGGELRSGGRAGVLIGQEIGVLIDGGFQKFFRTPSGIRKPATAEALKALHDFEEDLKETLGQKSLYNESLGTVSTYYLYDRVADRDRGVPKRVWES